MAEKFKFTDKDVKAVSAPEKGQSIVWDTDIAGFGLRVTPGADGVGRKTFIFNYRNKADGRSRRYKIGVYENWTVARARARAKELKQAVDRGEDPQGDINAVREAATMQNLCQQYLSDHAPSKRATSVKNDQLMIDKHILPRLGSRKVLSVEFGDIQKLHRAMSATPYAANRTVALLSKMFSLASTVWAKSYRWTGDNQNPCKGIVRHQEVKRERLLSGDERARLLMAMAEHGDKQTVSALRLAMLTGCRIGEALSASRDQFDLERGTWTKPASMTKQKKSHTLFLNPAAATLAGELIDKAKGAYLFPGRGGRIPQRDYKNSWRAVCDAAEITGLRVHDLRHNFASDGAAAGLSLPMIGALLGHSNPATTARYAHHFDDPLREAARRVGSRIEELCPKVGDGDIRRRV